jgi:hypothetical protein
MEKYKMPIRSKAQYGLMQAAAHGKLKGVGPPPDVAREFIEKTPEKKRRAFSKALAGKRKRGRK